MQSKYDPIDNAIRTRMRAMRDKDSDLADIPEITVAQMAHAVLRVNGRPVPKGKILIPLLLDTDIESYA